MSAASHAAAQLIVCTAGHIDHGKSRLVQALTGVDPDRLPEERARGMTIDLGFAHARLGDADVWFVDVPGHERFIRNMVAGASGVDLALLVVAADDAVMPQTREHAELLALLGVRRCVIALTKIDLVDAEWADAVELESRELLETLGLSVVACVHTSAVTGAGLPALRDALRAALAEPHPFFSRRWFRMAIDRAFSVPGRGTVVTGSLAHGTLRPDDELELWPPGRRVRVRELQAHNEARALAGGRMRLAVNLAGVTLEEVGRGQQLASVGYLAAGAVLESQLAWLRMPGRVQRRMLEARLHLGSGEWLARVRLPPAGEGSELRGVYAQVEPRAPLAAAHGDRFVLRDAGGQRTLGGGVVLRPVAQRWTRRQPMDAEGLAALSRESGKARLREVVRNQAWRSASAAQLAARAGLAHAEDSLRLLRDLATSGALLRLGTGRDEVVIAPELFDAVFAAVIERMRSRLAANPRWPGVPRREWAGWMPRACPAELREPLAQLLLDRGALELRGGFVLPPGEGGEAELPAEDRRLYERILAAFEQGGLKPPGVDELPGRTPRLAQRMDELVALAEARGALRRFAPGMWLHRRCWDDAVGQVRALLRARGAATLSEIRQELGTTRKYMVPLAEAFDLAGLTQRRGDQRVLAEEPASSAKNDHGGAA